MDKLRLTSAVNNAAFYLERAISKCYIAKEHLESDSSDIKDLSANIEVMQTCARFLEAFQEEVKQRLIATDK